MNTFCGILTLEGAGRHTFTPEKFGVWRLKWAMFKVGGIQIERARDQQFYFCQADKESGQKLIIFKKTENVLRIVLGGQYPWNPHALRTPNMYAKGVSGTSLSELFTPKVGWCRQNATREQKYGP